MMRINSSILDSDNKKSEIGKHIELIA